MSDFHDPENIVGDLFDRLATCQAEMGRDSLRRVAATVRHALGAAVLTEYERHAALLAERTSGPRPGDIRVKAWGQRQDGDPLDESIGPSWRTITELPMHLKTNAARPTVTAHTLRNIWSALAHV